VGISDRHRNGFVSHQFLNCSQIDTNHNKQTGEGVSDVVIPKSKNARLSHCCLKRSPWVFVATRARAWDYIPTSISLPSQDPESSFRGAVNRDVSAFSVLATWDGNDVQSKIYAFPAKAVFFAAPHSCLQARSNSASKQG